MSKRLVYENIIFICLNQKLKLAYFEIKAYIHIKF